MYTEDTSGTRCVQLIKQDQPALDNPEVVAGPASARSTAGSATAWGVTADPLESPSSSGLKDSKLEAGNVYTKSRIGAEYRAAGVLPLAEFGNKIYVLLGAEQRTRNGHSLPIIWSDFGGKREHYDKDVEATAGREFAEETLGLFNCLSADACSVNSSAAAMASQLRAGLNTLQTVHPLRDGSCYVMFVALTKFVDALFFDLATQQNLRRQSPIPGAEKLAFAWVGLDELLAGLKGKAGRYHLYLDVNSSGKRQRYRGHRRHIQLDPSFACSLRLAQVAGMENLACQALQGRMRLKRAPAQTGAKLPSEGTSDFVAHTGMFYLISKPRVVAELKGEICDAPWPSEEKKSPQPEDIDVPASHECRLAT